MNVHEPQRVSPASRLDRLPIFSFHPRMIRLLSFCFFIELADINIFAFSAPAIRAQWGISIATIGLITSATFFGMFIGATTGGWFADRMGRKRALNIAVVWFSLFSLLNAFAWEPIGLFGARLLTGIGLSAMTAIGITYIAEKYPARARRTLQRWVMGEGPFASTAAALVEHGFKLAESLTWASAIQLLGVPGAFIAGFISDRWQRKFWITLLAVFIATCGILYGLTFETIFIVTFGGLMTMGIQAFAPILYAYTAECFPTEIRSSGTGFTYGIGRLSNAFGPLVIAFLYATYGYQSVFVYIPASWLFLPAPLWLTAPLPNGKILA